LISFSVPVDVFRAIFLPAAIQSFDLKGGEQFDKCSSSSKRVTRSINETFSQESC